MQGNEFQGRVERERSRGGIQWVGSRKQNAGGLMHGVGHRGAGSSGWVPGHGIQEMGLMGSGTRGEGCRG